MKNTKRLVIVTALGFALGGLAIAQAHRAVAMGHELAQNHGDAASVAQHLAQYFPKIAAFDVNKDGILDQAEKETLGKAITDGTLQLPGHIPPHGVNPTPEMMLNHIVEMYAGVVPFDANHDCQLDQNEQAALQRAIENGEFAPHGSHPHPGGFHH